MTPAKWAVRLGLVLIGLSFLAGCNPDASRVQAAAPGSTPVPVPAGWITYASEPLGYAISHPPEMEQSENGTYSRIFTFTRTGGPAVNFVYISAVPTSFGSGDKVIYNYEPAEAGMLLAAKVGESVALHRAGDGSEAQAADPFTYTRVPDTIIAGQAAKTYVNDEPFEFPPGTQEIRIYVQTDEFIYLVGGYVDGASSKTPGAVSGALFNQIVSTFRLVR